MYVRMYVCMKNLIYHFPTCYAYSVKKAYRGTKPGESFKESMHVCISLCCTMLGLDMKMLNV